MQITAVTCTTKTSKENAPIKLLKRIGSTSYIVAVHFSETSKETMEDKIIRLMELEAAGQ